MTLFWLIFWIIVILHITWSKPVLPLNTTDRSKGKGSIPKPSELLSTRAINALNSLLSSENALFMSAEAKQEYMQSYAWKQLKATKLYMANYSCEHCNSTELLDLHHITYIRLGRESIDDVAILCRDCHTKLHNLLGYDRTTLYPLNTLN